MIDTQLFAPIFEALGGTPELTILLFLAAPIAYLLLRHVGGQNAIKD